MLSHGDDNGDDDGDGDGEYGGDDDDDGDDGDDDDDGSRAHFPHGLTCKCKYERDRIRVDLGKCTAPTHIV